MVSPVRHATHSALEFFSILRRVRSQCWHTGDAAEPPALPGMRTIVMADRMGKKYTCKMPATDKDAAKNESIAGKEVMRCPT